MTNSILSKNEQIFDLKKALLFANSIINTVREPLVVLYPELVIHSVNKSFYKIFKTEPENTIGKHIYELGDGQWNIPLLRKLLNETLTAKKSFNDFQVEHTFESIGHKVMLLNGSVIPVKKENDVMTLLAIEDITLRKVLEKKLEAKKEIARLNKHLIELAKQKDNFFYLTSHELKTPVTIIKVYLDLLKQQLEDAKNTGAAEMLSLMSLQISKLKNRVHDLLDTWKMEGGTLQYNQTHFNFNDLVMESINEMQLTTNHYKLEANLGKTVTIYADKERIEQVITNLLSNAIKFSSIKYDKIVVTSTVTRYAITLSIQDFGIGIEKGKQKKIFERFYRVSGAAENTYPGIGIGLYLSSAIIKKHGGELSVKSVKGEGATFIFKLPLKSKPIKKAAENKAVIKPSTPQGLGGAKE